jgi:outer membrane protein OmpA-like peptidoglycan-associated protein
MKKSFSLFFVLLLVFASIAVIAACSSPPPPVEAPPPPPEISVSLSPRPFSPDGDGVDDLLTINPDIKTVSPIRNWHIEIREPISPYPLFSEWGGNGMPDKAITWDGLNASGELVQSAFDYRFTMRVTNNNNESATYQGTIAVDVLVQREDDVLRVIIPSIVFAANEGDFEGLDSELLKNNDQILRRIADVLNKFDTYRIKVEGHANPTTAPGTRARAIEERGDHSIKGLLPLSEERAKAVVDYLVGLGVAQDRLTFVGVGSARIVTAFEDRDNWWKNRRVAFILEKPEN